MTSDDEFPGGAAGPAGTCKRPGCGNALPARDRGRTRQFRSDGCARRCHNDARIPVPAAAPDGDDPLAALDAVIRQAAGLDPARVRAQAADAAAELARTKAALEVVGKAHALLELLSGSADSERKPRK